VLATFAFVLPQRFGCLSAGETRGHDPGYRLALSQNRFRHAQWLEPVGKVGPAMTAVVLRLTGEPMTDRTAFSHGAKLARGGLNGAWPSLDGRIGLGLVLVTGIITEGLKSRDRSGIALLVTHANFGADRLPFRFTTISSSVTPGIEYFRGGKIMPEATADPRGGVSQ